MSTYSSSSLSTSFKSASFGTVPAFLALAAAAGPLFFAVSASASSSSSSSGSSWSSSSGSTASSSSSGSSSSETSSGCAVLRFLAFGAAAGGKRAVRCTATERSLYLRQGLASLPPLARRLHRHRPQSPRIRICSRGQPHVSLVPWPCKYAPNAQPMHRSFRELRQNRYSSQLRTLRARIVCDKCACYD